MTLTAKIRASIEGSLVGANDLGNPEQDFSLNFLLALTDGTGANQANNVFSDTRTIAASSSESLDLAGSLTNALGATLTFTAIKAIMIKASAANTNNVEIGGAASNAFLGPFMDATDKISLKPGGVFLYVNPSAAGDAVTAGTGDLLKIANSSSGAGVSYDVMILGEA